MSTAMQSLPAMSSRHSLGSLPALTRVTSGGDIAPGGAGTDAGPRGSPKRRSSTGAGLGQQHRINSMQALAPDQIKVVPRSAKGGSTGIETFHDRAPTSAGSYGNPAPSVAAPRDDPVPSRTPIDTRAVEGALTGSKVRRAPPPTPLTPVAKAPSDAASPTHF